MSTPKLPTKTVPSTPERTACKCRGASKCDICGDPCRQGTSGTQAFCRCCEALLTERERETLDFHGRWRSTPWGRPLPKRTNTFGKWREYVSELESMLQSVHDEGPVQ